MNHGIRLLVVGAFGVAVTTTTGCGGVDSEDDARLTSLGLNAIVVDALQLGFDGFNAADSANIPTQSADGDEAGTITVDGQVDQGASDNKGMRLTVTLDGYINELLDDPETDDEEELRFLYSTADGAPLNLELSLRDIPNGTLSGTLAGTVLVEEDLEAEVEVSLSFAGTIEDDGNGGTTPTDGGTNVTGTVESASGSFDVDFDI